MVETWIELIDRELELEHAAPVLVSVPVEDALPASVATAEELP